MAHSFCTPGSPGRVLIGRALWSLCLIDPWTKAAWWTKAAGPQSGFSVHPKADWLQSCPLPLSLSRPSLAGIAQKAPVGRATVFSAAPLTRAIVLNPFTRGSVVVSGQHQPPIFSPVVVVGAAPFAIHSFLAADGLDSSGDYIFHALASHDHPAAERTARAAAPAG